MSRPVLSLILALLLAAPLSPATVLVNSQDYRDVMAGAVYAAANGYALAFAIDPRQAVFITRYYSSVKTDALVYLEGNRTILPNMATLLRESGLRNLTVVQDTPLQEWLAGQFGPEQAILVGGTYGQDALSVAPYAAVSRSALFFIDEPSKADPTLAAIRARGYKQVLVYGPLARQLTEAQTGMLPNVRTIDTGSRYSNNIQIVGEFFARRPVRQVMFVSGRSFEKSMVDAHYPVVLVGRSSVPEDLAAFLSAHNVTSGVVFSGDSETGQGSGIVDGVARLRALKPDLSVFIKFGEGYSGVNQALPLMIIPLPAPTASISLLNISYNVAAHRFELRLENRGDFVFLSSSVFVKDIGSADSSQISLPTGQTTTLGVDLDASAAIAGGRIPSADVTVSYGEDSRLADNVDTVTFLDIPLSTYTDNSSVSLERITYDSEKKAFLLSFTGNGWVSGTVRFMLGSRPVVLDVPLAFIRETGTAEVKYLLSSDEEKYVRGLNSDYFIRFGARSDILLKEGRGQQVFSVRTASTPASLVPGADGSAGGLPLPMICAGLAVLLAALAGVHYYFRSRESVFE